MTQKTAEAESSQGLSGKSTPIRSVETTLTTASLYKEMFNMQLELRLRTLLVRLHMFKLRFWHLITSHARWGTLESVMVRD